MRTAQILLLLLTMPALAGCLDLGASTSAAGLDAGGGGDADAGDVPGDVADWPALDAAAVRPGVQVRSATGQCTSNFVFTSLDNASLYLGLAAHCVTDMELGESVDIANGAATGTLFYSSWMTMDDVEENDGAARGYNDFALIRIDDEHRDKVHPAMRQFGGPVALADTSKVVMGDRVLTYGNSGLRQQVEPLSWHEGYVTSRPDPWTTQVYTVTPGIPGDSGSGAMTATGEAFGVVVTLTLAPTAGSNGITSLDLALDYAKEHADIDVRLATWELLDDGLLGIVPV